MAGLRNLQSWQYDNVQRACNNAVREALFYGLDAGDLKRLLAECWEEILREKAELGAKEILNV
jgi:hypothetical protein